jgi:hypothetical protein
MVEKLISFIASAVERWKSEANQAGAALFPNPMDAYSLAKYQVESEFYRPVEQ